MLFKDFGQAAGCVVLAASFLWLAIQYRENHRAPEPTLYEAPPGLLEGSQAAVPLVAHASDLKLVAYEEEERPRVRLAQVLGATTSTKPRMPSQADISAFKDLPAPAAPKITVGDKEPPHDSSGTFLMNSLTFQVAGTDDKAAGVTGGTAGIVVYLNGAVQAGSLSSPDANSGAWSMDVTVPVEDDYAITAVRVLLDADQKQVAIGKPSPPVRLRIRTSGPHVTRVEPQNFAYTPKSDSVTVYFDPDHILDKDKLVKTSFVLKDGKGIPQQPDVTPVPNSDNSITLAYTNLSPDLYSLTVFTTKIADVFGNSGQSDYTTQLFKPVGGELPSVSPGIHSPTGPYVPFPEYLKPPPEPNGFNPGDHVETRVARLYYYRDAHRVAQVINRTAQSYNRAAVDMERQLADRARYIADKAQDDRQAKERAAVEGARLTREAEHSLQQADAAFRSAINEVRVAQGKLDASTTAAKSGQGGNGNGQSGGNGQGGGGGAQNGGSNGQSGDENPTSDDQAGLQNTVDQRKSVADVARMRAQTAFAEVQRRRAVEVQANEEAQAATAVEDRAREEQFRREVAAAHEDPDTYAPGKPGSKDYVRRVSLSVIGEGVIQLRGPIKGINEIRKMIHEIDAPVGQVNVAVHTVQVNGEHGNRMERVEERIQTYIDHSRFLTLQSAEMLRKAVVKVAAVKAAECNDLVGITQEDRDRKYLYSFFGADFIEELIALDSEFLHTGNKLLSLHSMDSTSLQSAMFLMALAKNSTRLAILTEFEQMTATALPMAEERYLEAGLTCDCPHKMLCKHRHAFQLLAGNARFESLRGMFDAEIVDDDTMTPVQREFLKLAQILKSRLVVELELNQRVMERAVIEERLGDTTSDLRKAKCKEDEARRELENATKARIEALSTARRYFSIIRARFEFAERSDTQGVQRVAVAARSGAQAPDKLGLDPQLEKIRQAIKKATADGAVAQPVELTAPDGSKFQCTIAQSTQPAHDVLVLPQNDESIGPMLQSLKAAIDFARNAVQLQVIPNVKLVELLQGIYRDLQQKASDPVFRKNARLDAFALKLSDLQEFAALTEQIQLLEQMTTVTGQDDGSQAASLLGAMDRLTVELSKGDIGGALLYQRWVQIRNGLTAAKWPDDDEIVSKMEQQMQTLLQASVDQEAAEEAAKAHRRPLDHKKFLDMLIDDMEDKFVELLEGTRAHTANIDAYIKRLVTSLNDDFNTQFYYPAFRQVRRASRMWDVTLGQIETTSILANNRSFAKVSPQATMEFDLPKRDIVIAEAMNGAKAAVQDFGALVQDPAFLSLAKLNSGQSTATPAAGATGGLATVRDVLPGLSTDTAEQVLAQHGPGNQKLGSALESLIPDPAVYKFETGTGYEIRPVIQPDGQAVVFHLNYMYTTNVREPVRPDEKHLGRVKRHFIDTDVQLSNYELREVSRYQVALKASRTSQGVPLLQDIPIAGVLFRPLPSAESSLQENLIMAQATIFPTLFDLMGLRWAPAVADLDPLRLENDEFIVRSRRRAIMNRVYDYSSGQVDAFLRIPEAERRSDLYRSQETIPSVHPNGYEGPGLNLRDSQIEEGFNPPTAAPSSRFIPSVDPNGSRSRRPGMPDAAHPVPWYPHSHGRMPEGTDLGPTFPAELEETMEDSGAGAEPIPLPAPSDSHEGRRSRTTRPVGPATASKKGSSLKEPASFRRASDGRKTSSRTAAAAPEDAIAKGSTRRAARKRTSNPTR